jgi:hypothetical protein
MNRNLNKEQASSQNVGNNKSKGNSNPGNSSMNVAAAGIDDASGSKMQSQ